MTRNYKADLVPRPDIVNPTQQDLHDHPDPYYHVDIDASQGVDGKLNVHAPIYYNTQHIDGLLHIHYLFLYKFQYGQTVRATRPGAEFDTQIWRIGPHSPFPFQFPFPNSLPNCIIQY
jgi:hypothetical protein